MSQESPDITFQEGNRKVSFPAKRFGGAKNPSYLYGIKMIKKVIKNRRL